MEALPVPHPPEPPETPDPSPSPETRGSTERESAPPVESFPVSPEYLRSRAEFAFVLQGVAALPSAGDTATSIPSFLPTGWNHSTPPTHRFPGFRETLES